MGLDFSHLYSLLDLEPDCSLEELKLAYRKRVAELHPDRQALRPDGSDEGTGSAGIQLAALTPLYRRALRFHELHGRLPGSDTGDATAPGPLPTARQASRRPRSSRSDADASSRIPASHWWLLAALACLVAYLVFGTSAPLA